MKRITYWILATVSVLVLLFSYHTSTSGSLVARTSVHSGSFSSSAGSTGTTATPSTPSTGTVGQPSPVQRKLAGSVVSTRYGPVQVELTIDVHKIVKASVLQYPQGNDTDAQINDYALPILTRETINAQSAKIDMVSGATYTSAGYIQSAQSILDQANL